MGKLPGRRSILGRQPDTFRQKYWSDRGFLLLFVLLLEGSDHGRVGQGGRVAERPSLGDVPEQAAHDLARARLGQLRREDDVVGPRQRPDLLGDVLLELVLELL